MAKSVNSVYNMPDLFVSDEEKMSEAYGLKYAQYIEHQELLSENFVNRKNTWIENRQFMEGNQPVDRLKKTLLEGDRSYAKYDFTPIAIIPRFTNSIKENLALDLYSPKVQAIDPKSAAERKEELRKIQKNRYNGWTRQVFSEMMGVDIAPDGFTPESDEDQELYMKTEYVQSQEVAMEQAISVVLKINRYSAIRDKLVDDILATSRCVVKTDYDEILGVRIEYVDSVRYINSLDTSRLKDKRDAYYHGDVRFVSYAELAAKYGMSKAECLAHQAQLAGNTRRIIDLEKWDDIASYMVEVLFFEFKTVMNPTFRKKYGRNGESFTIKKKSSDYENENENVEVLRGEDVVWMEGAYVLSSDKLLFYRKRAWQTYTPLREKLPSYHVYDTEQMPVVRKMIPAAEKAHMALIKLDQMIAKARPKGLAINESALADIIDKEGGEPMGFLELVNMYDGTGSMIYRQDALTGSGVPITELENGLSRDAMQYFNIYNARIQELYFMSGMNPVATGAAPESRTSTESNKIALNNSLASINYIKKALVGNDVGVEYRLYQDIILRIINIDKYDSRLFKDIVRSIGENNYDELMNIDTFGSYAFTFDIQSAPTVAEQEELREDITLAIQSQQITLADKIELNTIKSPKLALIMLKNRIAKNQKLAQQNAIEQMEAQQKAGEAERQGKIAFEAQMEKLRADQKIRIEEAQRFTKIENTRLQGEIDFRIAGVKGFTAKELAKISSETKAMLQSSMEEQKNMRQEKQQNFQRTQAQSKLI